MAFQEATIYYEVNVGSSVPMCSVYIVLGPPYDDAMEDSDYYTRHPQSVKIIGPAPAAVCDEAERSLKLLLERLGLKVKVEVTADD